MKAVYFYVRRLTTDVGSFAKILAFPLARTSGRLLDERLLSLFISKISLCFYPVTVRSNSCIYSHKNAMEHAIVKENLLNWM